MRQSVLCLSHVLRIDVQRGAEAHNGSAVDLPYTSLDEATKTGVALLAACASTHLGPMHVLSIVRTGLSTIRSTPDGRGKVVDDISRWQMARTRTTVTLHRF